jgi:hypothetical protein
MPCALTQSNLIPCRSSRGGVDEFYIAALEDKITGQPTSTSGIITAFTMQSGKKFWTYKMEKENASFFDNIKTDPANGSKWNEQGGTAVIKQLTAANRNEFELLAQNRVMIIYKDGNGLYWLLGETNGLDITSIDGGTGKAYNDLNGYTITFAGREPVSARQVTGSLMTALTNPA